MYCIAGPVLADNSFSFFLQNAIRKLTFWLSFLIKNSPCTSADNLGSNITFKCPVALYVGFAMHSMARQSRIFRRQKRSKMRQPGNAKARGGLIRSGTLG